MSKSLKRQKEFLECQLMNLISLQLVREGVDLTPRAQQALENAITVAHTAIVNVVKGNKALAKYCDKTAQELSSAPEAVADGQG